MAGRKSMADEIESKGRKIQIPIKAQIAEAVEQLIDTLPEKIDLSTFELGEDGDLQVTIDEKNDNITGENLVHLAKYAESKGFNDAIDQISAKLPQPIDRIKE